MSLVNEPVEKNNNRKKYCRFKKAGIKYIDYKNPDFLLKLVNEQGKILPRRLTGTRAFSRRFITLKWSMRISSQMQIIRLQRL